MNSNIGKVYSSVIVTVRTTAAPTKSRIAEEMMIRNTGESKSKLRSRSTRKPLRDVSNGRISVSSCGLKKISGEDRGEKADDSFDRLLLVHSDISSILRQIDELIVQALRLKSNGGWKEIKPFADMLSDMQAPLKSWVPKVQKVLSCQQPVRSDETKPEQSIEQTVVSVPKESNDKAIESPEPTKWESLLSPSPLVSWRAECNVEGGRQLFLLTPLARSMSFSSKLQATSTAVPRMTSEETSYPVSPHNTMPEIGPDLPETESNYSNTNRSMFVLTPSLKLSPPKSCALLEPVSALSRKKKQEADDSGEPESSSSQSSGDLNVKYPELFGINIKSLQNSVAADDSPDWLVSPPKSCVIMEPLDDKTLNNPAGDCMAARTAPADNQKDKRNDHQGIFCTLDLAETTPMMKEPTSIARIGRHPGENTLKRELWMKFEAASSHDIVHSILTSASKKGFLDRMEEKNDFLVT